LQFTKPLFSDKRHQGSIHPAHINSGYKQPSAWQDEFFWTGTMDYSPYLSVTAGLQFREAVGGEEAICNYTHKLARDGGAYLASQFQTEVLQEEDQMGNMVDVRLPFINPNHPILTGGWLVDTLLYRHPTMYAAIYYHNGNWWTRLSAQIYNDMSDFEAAGVIFRSICDEVNTENGTVSNGVSTTLSSRSIQLAAASTVLAFEL
jgi:selenocysteine lyase/cysteine desulfurase